GHPRGFVNRADVREVSRTCAPRTGAGRRRCAVRDNRPGARDALRSLAPLLRAFAPRGGDNVAEEETRSVHRPTASCEIPRVSFLYHFRVLERSGPTVRIRVWVTNPDVLAWGAKAVPKNTRNILNTQHFAAILLREQCTERDAWTVA